MGAGLGHGAGLGPATQHGHKHGWLAFGVARGGGGEQRTATKWWQGRQSTCDGSRAALSGLMARRKREWSRSVVAAEGEKGGRQDGEAALGPHGGRRPLRRTGGAGKPQPGQSKARRELESSGARFRHGRRQ
ncbi:hypothetical protein NL676_035150 [Syzygium grande]|nr:hypothetical protein NL676_035150 [Syzygium grande]